MLLEEAMEPIVVMLGAGREMQSVGLLQLTAVLEAAALEAAGAELLVGTLAINWLPFTPVV